jgi:hypothetical protein
LGAVGKVTKENLDPIIERIPQLAAIIKEKFGPEALGDTAKTFEKLGISSQQFIRIITDELAKGERAGNTYKNSWENIQMAAKDAAAEFGKTLLPIAQRVLDDFLTPGIDKAKALATAFGELPKPTQDWALGLTAVATAAPLAIVAMGTLIEKGTLILGVLNKGVPIIKAFAGSLSLAGVAAGAAAAGVGLFLKWLIDHGGKPVDTTAAAIDNLKKKYDGQILSTGQASDMLVGYMKTIGQATPAVEKHANAHAAAAVAVENHAKAYDSLKLPTLDVQLLHERMREVMGDYRKKLSDAAGVMKEYGAVTLDGAIAAARMADEQFRLNRALEEAPAMPWKNLDFKSIPKAEMPTFPGDFEAYKKSSKNIGPEGMMTKEQFEAQKQRFKELGKAGKAAYQQISTVATDLSRGIADVIFKGGSLADMFTNVAKQAAQSITRLLIEGALKKLTDKLFDVGGLMGKVFGGGGLIKSAATNGMGDLGGAAASSASGGIGGAASAATSSLAGIVGAVGSVVSAVSGVIGNFQMAGMNKSLDLIEKEVRYSQIHLLNLLEKNNEFLPNLKNIWESLVRMETRQMAVADAGGGATVTININGGNPQQTLADLTRLLKQYGVITR